MPPARPERDATQNSGVRSAAPRARDGVREGALLRNHVDIGWVILGALDEVDREAVHRAQASTLEALQSGLPEFEWRMPVVEHRDLPASARLEPSDLIEQGIYERDSQHFDLVLMITGAELVGHGRRPYALGISSRALGIGVLSTVRIDPLACGWNTSSAERATVIARRVRSLALHVLGDLLGAAHETDTSSAMTPIESVEALDAIEGLTEQTLSSFRPALRQIADLRLEERRHPPDQLWFFARAAWMNATTILGATWQARPWELPFRLGRLSAAAVSALVVLLMAAESWQLALELEPTSIAVLGALSLCGACVHMLKRQRLLMSVQVRLTEQIVITNLSTVLTIGSGLLVAFALLFAFAFVFTWSLFPTHVIVSWADVSVVEAHDLLRVAGVMSSVGLIIGTLGASFESQSYFRHVTYVDEELG